MIFLGYDVIKGIVIGTVSTAIGAVIGSFITLLIKNWGKISFNIRDWRMDYYNINEFGNFIKTGISNAAECKISAVIQIYNSAR